MSKGKSKTPRADCRLAIASVDESHRNGRGRFIEGVDVHSVLEKSDTYFGTKLGDHGLIGNHHGLIGNLCLLTNFDTRISKKPRLPKHGANLEKSNQYQQTSKYPRPPIENVIPKGLLLIYDGYGRNSYGRQASEGYGVLFILTCYVASIGIGGAGLYWVVGERRHWRGGSMIAFALLLDLIATLSGGFDCLPWHWRRCLQGCSDSDNRQSFQHDWEIVQQKLLTPSSFRYTVITRELDMANVLNTDKQIAIIGQLAEGSSIRSIERITGVHRDTIMRLGVKVGQGCTALMDASMRNLPCRRLELDEIWGFVGKKDRQVRRGDSMEVGSVWTWCAIDADTKLVPAFRVGDRGAATAVAFLRDVADRMAYRVQISTDGLTAYVDAVEKAFGADVDYAQIIKTYGHEETTDNRRYSAPEFVSSEKKIIAGRPDVDLISTSYVERLNATTRLHMRRLTRLTLAFSKKRENFEAAVGLHFAYYNFVKRHNTLRCTPAMAAGVTPSFWSVGDLLEATA